MCFSIPPSLAMMHLCITRCTGRPWMRSLSVHSIWHFVHFRWESLHWDERGTTPCLRRSQDIQRFRQVWHHGRPNA